MEDIKNKDIEKVKEDLVVVREFKKGFDEKLVEIRKEFVYVNVDKIVNVFFRRGENVMKFV